MALTLLPYLCWIRRSLWYNPLVSLRDEMAAIQAERDQLKDEVCGGVELVT
jgi:hypothetical protein